MIIKNRNKQVRLLVQLQGKKNNEIRAVTLTPLFFGTKKGA
ncbi:hypothetical protein ALT1644_50035 [Alteromonas macleodii]